MAEGKAQPVKKGLKTSLLRLILHVVDEATRYQAARWLQNITAKDTWEVFRLCWIDVFLDSPPDYVLHDAGKNFVSREFRQFASFMAVTFKSVSVEAHWIVEPYHAVLRRVYLIIMEHLDAVGVSKEVGLQMSVKAVNDTAGPYGLVSTLLLFGAFPRMHAMDPPASSIIQRAASIKKAMDEVKKIHAERQVADALNTRNGPVITPLHDLPINANVLVWREAGKTGKWTGLFVLLGIEGETRKISPPSGPTDFRTRVVKPYLEVDDSIIT